MRLTRASQRPAGTIPSLSDEEVDRFARIVRADSGIRLDKTKKALLVERLVPRLRSLRLRSFAAYLEHLEQKDPSERTFMVEAVCTHETQFFREPWQFEFLLKKTLPELRQQARRPTGRRRVRALCAGCSSGEEPYSVAMTLLDGLPSVEGWEHEVVAVDISRAILGKAATGVWPAEKTTPIPERYVRKFMLKGTGVHAGHHAAGPEIRSVVRFRQLNLHAGAYPVGGPFDFVFCRNVLIYFDRASKAGLVTKFLSLLSPNGLLLLGHAEALNAAQFGLRMLAPAVYARTSDATETQQ